MDDLQFDKAEFSNPSGIGPCVMCSAKIESEYWHANGQVVCPNCAVNLGTAQQAPARNLLLKGTVYAVVAAIGCSIARVYCVWRGTGPTSAAYVARESRVAFRSGGPCLRGVRNLGHKE